MVKLIVRALLLLLTFGWIGGIWFAGDALEKRLRSMIRDDPSNVVEVVFDPFAEPEEKRLLDGRAWLSMVDFRQTFFATIARLQLNVRLTAGEDPIALPLLLKFHHGPLIFAGGFAVGAARLQITLDNNSVRNPLPPRWGLDAKPYEGSFVARGVLGFDGAFQGQSWLQQIAIGSPALDLDLERMWLSISTDGMLSMFLIKGKMSELTLRYESDSLGIATADLSLRANNFVVKSRYEGLMSMSWEDAALKYQGESRHVASMSVDTEYRLDNKKLSAEVDISAEKIGVAGEEQDDRPILLDYVEAVIAVGELPEERALELWDDFRLWEPPVAALSEGQSNDLLSWNVAEILMNHVSSDVSAYGSLKLGLNSQELLVRTNAEFMGDGDVEHLRQVKTLGELFNYLLADFTYQVDGRLADIPVVQEALDVALEMNMLEMDEYGPSGSVHVQAGRVRVNGMQTTSEQFLRELYSQPLWWPGNSRPTEVPETADKP